MANYIKNRGEMFGENRKEMTPARRKMIHDHRKHADTYGPELPVQIGTFKPKLGNKPNNIEHICECGHRLRVSSITHAVICPKCSKCCVVK